MCNRKTHAALILFLSFFVLIAVVLPASAEQQIKGQRPMLVIDDTFQFIPGTWAKYAIRDKKRQQDYEMIMAVLDRERRGGMDCSWMEVTIRAEDTPEVVTRFLVPMTSRGPGKPLAAIVQMEGYDPFTVPDSFMEGDDAEVGQRQTFHLVKKLETRTIQTRKGKTVKLWQADAVNDRGEHITAWVSDELPPLGLYEADTPEAAMHIKSWGTDARSGIRGEPMNFYLWLTSVVSKAISEGVGK